MHFCAITHAFFRNALYTASMDARPEILLTLSWLQLELYRSIVSYAVAAGWRLRSDLHMRHSPANWSGDGIISTFGTDRQALLLERHGDKPAVGVFMSHLELPVPRVAPDDTQVGQLAAAHFLDRGFRNFLVLMPSDNWANHHRMAGFADTLARAGLACEEHVLTHELGARSNSPTPQEESAWIRSHLQAAPKPLAVFCSYESMFADPTAVALEAGLRVPEQVAFVSINNEAHEGQCAAVPLTCVEIDWAAVGHTAAQCLQDQLDGEAAHVEPLFIPPRGITARTSSDILAVEDMRVSRAIRFIREKFGHNIGVADIAKAVDTPRRTLEYLFRKHLGRGVGAELLRYRIEVACTLLVETDLTATAIALRTGFQQAGHFYRQFHLKTGLTAKQYRRSARDTAQPPGAITSDRE